MAVRPAYVDLAQSGAVKGRTVPSMACGCQGGRSKHLVIDAIWLDYGSADKQSWTLRPIFVSLNGMMLSNKVQKRNRRSCSGLCESPACLSACLHSALQQFVCLEFWKQVYNHSPTSAVFWIVPICVATQITNTMWSFVRKKIEKTPKHSRMLFCKFETKLLNSCRRWLCVHVYSSFKSFPCQLSDDVAATTNLAACFINVVACRLIPSVVADGSRPQ